MDEAGRSNTQQSAAVFPGALDVPMLTPDWWLREEGGQLTGREKTTVTYSKVAPLVAGAWHCLRKMTTKHHTSGLRRRSAG